MKVKVKKVREGAVIPQYQTPGAAGFDLHVVGTHLIKAGATMLISTGLAVEVPMDYEMQVVPRSGMSLKTPIRIANSPGCIDSDYRGEVKIICHNTGDTDFVIENGERIAQGKITPVMRVEFELVDELSDTERGEGGFGSTDGPGK